MDLEAEALGPGGRRPGPPAAGPGSAPEPSPVVDLTPAPDLNSLADALLLSGRLDRLSLVIAELAGALDVADLNTTVVSHAAAAVDAVVASLSLLDDDGCTLRLIGISGAQSDTAERWGSHPVSADVPAGEAVRTCAPVLVAGSAAIEARYPVLAGQMPGERSLVCLPLVVRGQALGAIALIFAGHRLPDSRELAFLVTLADACAQALDRIRAHREAAERRDRLEFLAGVSAELASSLDYRTTLAQVARLAVPRLADWVTVDILEDGRLQTLAVAHVDPAKVALAERLQQRYPTDPDSPTGAPNVLRTGVSELYPEITDEMLVASARDAEHLRITRELRLRSALVVPLTSHTRVLGAITMIAAESGRRYGLADVAFVEDVARRAAVAIDNAQLHTETLEAAIRLQQAILPAVLPAVPGYEVAAEYRAAGRTEVGGDFYDVIPLPDGRVAFAVGDVMGRGVAAAAAMAQMRAAVRAYVAIDPEPGAVLGNLDLMFADQGMFAARDSPQLVTLLYLLADGDRVAVGNAGHPPPLLLGPDGSAEFLPMADDVPLGVASDTRTASFVHLPPGAILLVYTDGLIERRREDIGEGLDRLLVAGRNLGGAPLGPGLRQLVEALQDPERDDDVTAVAVRRTA
jgi:serine phosphatase RsbU (regulator of sigma subunit)